MATQEARGPDDGSEPSPAINPANVHFFRPNDGIYVSEGPEQRTICVSPYLPPAMARSGEWHVEQFELHKELYRGKTSLLYMATDRISGVQVALKLYRKRKLSVLNRYQVEREVRLHINLHHENIIHLFAAFEDEKHVYMVQEFAVCGDLFEDLKKGGGQLKEKYAVRDVIVPFLSALSYLHSQGIIHRDIKPENILLGANKTIKVADFGLSININHERPVTRAGTLDYMAPEVLVCPDKRRPEENKDKVLLGYTAQVDSWAVGILAYELLVGYPPFEQESRAATYEYIMYKEPKFPSWMTEDAKKFIGLALCKNASQRPTVFELMQHPWVQPYMMRHMQPSSAPSGAPGPSRLRNSVSHMSGDVAGREAAALGSSSTNGMIMPQKPVTSSATGLTAAGQHAGAATGAGTTRLFVPMPAPPAAAPPAAAAAAQPQSSAESGLGAYKQPQPHTHPHPQQQQSQMSSSTATSRPQGPSPTIAFKSSISLHEKPTLGSQDPITGVDADGGRIHESISEPSARGFESPSPHPPGAASAAYLYSGGGGTSGGGAGSRGGAGTADIDRSGTHSHVAVVGGGGTGGMNGAAAVRAAQLSGASVGNMASRLVHVNSHGLAHPHAPTGNSATRGVVPPLTLDPADPVEMGGGAASGNDMYIPPGSPCTSARGANGMAPGGTPMASRTTPQPHAPAGAAGGGQGMGGGGGMAPRLRMTALVPPVNIGGGALSGSSVRLMHAPAPPISPKPLTPDAQGPYHRPASGVLSDDSFMPPTRSPSMSLGPQMLSPLQAQLMAPRPSSRLNSPSHSRRNSVSQAGQSAGGVVVSMSAQQQVSMPLPNLLSADYGGEGSMDELVLRSSSSHRGLMVAPAVGPNGAKVFGKLWGRDPGSVGGVSTQNGVCSGESSMELGGFGAGTGSAGALSARSGGGAAAAGGGGPVAPAAAAAAGGGRATGARVRMMTPDEVMMMRPLMRESSMSSSFKSSGGGAGNLREELMQQSLTVYHRPGKVPGIGRAALAAREAEAAEMSGLGGLGHGSAAGGLGKTKSLVNRNLNGVMTMEENGGGGGGGGQLARLGSEAALARTVAGAERSAAASGSHAVATQRSFTSANSAFARKLANGAIATKVTEYVKGRLPHDDDMGD